MKRVIRNSKVSPKVKGYIGERYVDKYLSIFPYKIHDIKITQPQKTQIDHIIICDKGIIIIETKNYFGLIKGNYNDHYWIQYTNNRKNKFINPIKQNDYHLKTLTRIFPKYKDLFVSIIVFLPKVKIITDNKNNIVFLNHLRKYISNLPTKNINIESQEKIYEAIIKLKALNIK